MRRGVRVSRGFYQYLQKQYGNVVASGRGQCVFVSADDESAFRQTADEFVSDMSLTRVVRIRMYPDDSRSPFSLVQAILKSLIDITGKDIGKLINPSMLKSYEYSLLKSFYFGKPLPEIDFPLPNELEYHLRAFANLLTTVIDALTRGSQPILILVSGFGWAGPSALLYLETFTRHLSSANTKPGSYLFVTSFQQKKDGSGFMSGRTWDNWIWELECHGRIYHGGIEIGDYLSSAEWGTTGAEREAGTGITWGLDAADRLIHLMCFGEAGIILRSIEKECSRTGTNSQRIRHALFSGRAELFSGQHEEAQVYFDRLNGLGQRYNLIDTVTEANIELAYTELFRGNYTEAARYSDFALCYMDSVSSRLRIEAEFCNFVVTDCRNMPYGYKELMKLIDALERNDMTRELIYVLRSVYAQEPFMIELTPETSLRCCERAIGLADKVSSEHDIAAAEHAKGVVYVKMGDVETAIACLKRSEKLSRSSGSPGDLTRVLNGIGYLYCQKEDFRHALIYYREALTTVLDKEDFPEISNTLYNIAWLYYITHQYGDALTVLKSLFEILKLRDVVYFPFHSLHDVFILQGLCYFAQGMVVHSEQMVESSINLSIPLSDEGALFRPLLKSLICTSHLQKEAAFEELTVAGEVYRRHAQLTVQSDLIYHNISTMVLRRWGDTERALSHARDAVKICNANGFAIEKAFVQYAWNNNFAADRIQYTGGTISEVLLNQAVIMVRHERSVDTMRRQVSGMRLCSGLQRLTAGSDDSDYISVESLRRLCLFFNLQTGAVLLSQAPKGTPACARYSQPHSPKIEEKIFREVDTVAGVMGHDSREYVFHNVETSGGRFPAAVRIKLFDVERPIGSVVLLSTRSDVRFDENDSLVLEFAGNLIAAKLVNNSQKKRLLQMSLTDVLTGLRNRQCLETVFAEALAQDENCVIAFFDVDNFKYYNDGFGHDVGDQVLIIFSSLLHEMENSRIKAGRWGGDEFIMIFFGFDSSEAVKMLLELQEKLAGMKDLRETISKNIGRVLPDKPLTISCSIGVTESTRNGMRFSEAEILKKADEALYIVKKGNRKGTLMEL